MTALLLTSILLALGSPNGFATSMGACSVALRGEENAESGSDNSGIGGGDSTGDPREVIERELVSLAMQQRAAIAAHETGLKRAKSREFFFRNLLIVSLLAISGICIAIVVSVSRRRHRELGSIPAPPDEIEQTLDSEVENKRLQSLGLMAGGVAHDFNNLLVGIMGNAELLKCNDPPVGRDRESILNELLVCTNKAAELSQRLLIYADGQSSQKRVHDFGLVVRANQELLQSTLGRNCILSLEIAAEPLPVYADATQLEQVLLNLVTNACRASNDRGKIIIRTGYSAISQGDLSEPFVFTKRSAGGDFVTLEVEDFGHGISDEDLNRMFEPFYSRSPGGRGLGLALVYAIVTAHDGVIQVASREGFGTSIKVSLPILSEAALVDASTVGIQSGPRGVAVGAEPEVAAFGSVSASIVPETAANRGSWPGAQVQPDDRNRREKFRLLIVEDDSQVATSLTTMFKTQPVFEVHTARHGLDALAVLNATPEFDCVLLDVAMPVMDGRRFLEQCDLPVPIVAMSGFSTAALGDLVQDPRIKKFMSKPFHREELFAAIFDAANSRRGQTTV